MTPDYVFALIFAAVFGFAIGWGWGFAHGRLHEINRAERTKRRLTP